MSPNIVDKRPGTPPENSGEAKFNPFQPEMPRIPGVSDGSRHASKGLNVQKQSRLPQILAIVAVVLVLSGVAFWWFRNKLRSSDVASVGPESSEQNSSAPSTVFSNPVATVHDGPSMAGTVEELSKPWSAKKFSFIKPITHESVDAMVIRLPSGELWAFSLQA